LAAKRRCAAVSRGSSASRRETTGIAFRAERAFLPCEHAQAY
jgi:hypothetical protein